MFYPELKMPYMPVSNQKSDPAIGLDMDAVELKNVELAMVCLSLLLIKPRLFWHLTCAYACLVAGDGGGKKERSEGRS
jgi:hypothetical protein